MRLRHELSEEDLSSGFTPETDIFGLKDFADRLTSLFSNLRSGSVCLLDGRWGSGKTTFVKQWMYELKNNSFPTIYFDAFSSDYVDSPFTALTGVFVRAVHDAQRRSDPKFREFLDRAAAVGKFVASTAAKVGVKAITLGVVDGSELSDIEGLSSALADGAEELSESSLKRLLEEHAERDEQFLALKKSLHELPNLLRPESAQAERPMIVFVDELDRCRPDFSLGILEVIKHFFKVENIHFVLVTSERNLSLAVNHRYGQGIHSSEYLEKFYDFVVPFENVYVPHQNGSVAPFIDQVMDRFVPQRTQADFDLREMVKNLSMQNKLSLRQIENFAINTSLSYLSVRDLNIFRPAILIAAVALIKTRRLDVYRKIKGGNATWAEIDPIFPEAPGDDRYASRVREIMQWHSDSMIDANDPKWKHFGQGLWNYNLERFSVLPFIANSVIDRFSQAG